MAPRKSATDGTAKPAVLKKEEVKEVVPTEKKYRCDFKTWKEYEAYKGPKG